MRFQLLLLFMILQLSVMAQWSPDPCPIDSTSDLVLDFVVSVNDSADGLHAGWWVKDISNEDCESFLYDFKTGAITDYRENFYYNASTEQIKRLNISVSNHFLQEFIVDLDTFSLLNSIQVNELREFTIECNGAVNFHLDQWEMYDGLVSGQSLRKLKFKTRLTNENAFKPFLEFTELTELESSQYLSEELRSFPNLEVLSVPNTYYHLVLPITNLQKLKQMPSLGLMSDRDSDLFAQISFLSSALDPAISNHPFYKIHHAILKRKELDSSFTGSLVITYGDAFEDLSGTVSAYTKDTLGFGSVVNGEPTGVWRYKVPDFLAFGPIDWYYYNYNFSTEQLPPKNGTWRYYYGNGQLAISGKMRNNLKHGKWKFYEPDGNLVHIQHHRKGIANGLFITSRSYPEDFESRKYYSNGVITMFAYQLEGKYQIRSGWKLDGRANYMLYDYGDLRLRGEDGLYTEVVPKDSRKYKRIMQQYLKTLYPNRKISLDQLAVKND